MMLTLPFVRKATAFLTAACVLCTSALATDISDAPMPVKNTVLPNIMFTLDDSGSMQFEVIPESTDVYFTFPRPATLYGAAWGYGGSYDTKARFEISNRYARFFRTARFNPLYYNPAIRYQPWSLADGSLMGNSSPTAACHNPNKCPALTSGSTSEGTLDLTTDQTWNTAWRNDDGTETTASRTFYPATYFNYTGSTPPPVANHANNVQTDFTLVEIKSANAPFPKAAGRTDCAAATCTYTEEIQNFANWYTYYRSRILAARAGIGRAFSAQGEGMRVGYAALNKGSTTVDGVSTSVVEKGVRKFTGTDRTNFFTTLYGYVMPSSGTPLRYATDKVGQYFMRTDNAGPWGETPGSSTGTQFACRQNYHILMTDGYWNTGSGAASTAGARTNNDGTGGPTHTNDRTPATPPTYTYSAVNPYTDSYSDTLADVGMYYWKTDLRTDMQNNVPPNSKDPAFWQHMVNFTVGFGVTGTVSSADIASAFTSTPATITWPDPTASDPNKVDDLAHAAVNSRGGYFSASDPATFATALTDTLQDITSRVGASAAVAVANANLVSGDSALYASGYNSGDWTGELSAFDINPVTGAIATTATWTAQAQLDALAHGSRMIASYTGTTGTGQGIQFQPTSAPTATKLSTAQQTLLNTPLTTDGASVLAWLRGDRSLEGTTYRTRAHVLGDIINSEPVIVRDPRSNYLDNGYAAFKTANASRTKTLFQGANDGMMHAFKADNPNGGSELWAYVPNLVLSSLNLLSRKSGFAHRYYVDATPSVGDVDFNNTNGASGSPDWHTILVGGLGKGGRGFFALDVTNPVASSEADAAAKVLWEFPNSATSATHKNNIGYSFGKPIIVKTPYYGWVVLVTSGYNNGTDTGGDGQGYLFVLNARTGDVIAAIATGVGSSADPSGLAQIQAFVENANRDMTTGPIYGGDLKGNVWRFDLSASASTSWNVKKIATLVDASNNYQPISSMPNVSKIRYGGVYKRLVYVGTGLYLGDSDVPGTTGANIHATQTQTMYVLVDDLSSTPTISPLRSNLVQQTVTTGGTFTINEVDYAVKKGWYLDLPTTGERINTNPALGYSSLIFTTNVPNSDPCVPGGSSYFYVMDYAYIKGLSSSFITSSRLSLGNVLASRPVLVRTSTGDLKAIIRLSDATTGVESAPKPVFSTATRRITWRELPE